MKSNEELKTTTEVTASKGISIGYFLATSKYGRKFNPALMAGFETWMKKYHPDKYINRLGEGEWESLYKEYVEFKPV